MPGNSVLILRSIVTVKIVPQPLHFFCSINSVQMTGIQYSVKRRVLFILDAAVKLNVRHFKKSHQKGIEMYILSPLYLKKTLFVYCYCISLRFNKT